MKYLIYRGWPIVSKVPFYRDVGVLFPWFQREPLAILVVIDHGDIIHYLHSGPHKMIAQLPLDCNATDNILKDFHLGIQVINTSEPPNPFSHSFFFKKQKKNIPSCGVNTKICHVLQGMINLSYSPSSYLYIKTEVKKIVLQQLSSCFFNDYFFLYLPLQ